jgi:hypothetical protein
LKQEVEHEKDIYFLLYVVFSIFAFSEETNETEKKVNENDSAFLTISMLLKDGLNKNFHLIQQESIKLTNEQRIIM